MPNNNKNQNAGVSAKNVTPVTVLNVEMTEALQTTLKHPGATAYVVYFDQHAAGNPPIWTPLVDDGTIKGGGKASVTLTKDVDGAFQDLNGGKIYILIQSGSADLKTHIKSEADINWGSAKQYDYRYDSFEVTLENGPDDKGNLTSVNGFGIPMELSVKYADNTTETLGYNITANDIAQKIATATGQPIDKFSTGPLSTHYREMISPSVSVAEKDDHTFSPSDWNGYINQMKVANTGVQVSGFYNGSADAVSGQYGSIYHNAGFFGYTLEWDAKQKVFWLSPDEASQIKGFIQLTADDLANSIYSTLGNVGIYETKDSKPYQILDHAGITNSAGHEATMNTGENNQWGNVLTQFLTGFSAGYYKQMGDSLNPDVKEKIDLSKSWNWDPTYAFGENLDTSGPVHKDKYSEVFFQNSNSYGSNYSDNLMAQYTQGGPLMSMSDPKTGQNVKTINLTLFDDAETPTGYVPPTIANYIDAKYLIPTALSGNSIGLNLANATVVVADGTKITLDFLKSNGAHGPVWQSVEFTPASGHSLWQTWEIKTGQDGNFYAAEAGGTPIPGQMLITNFPGTAAGTYWSRLTVGDGDTAKTFNLYTTIAKGTSQFVNPAADPAGNSLAVDGLATIAPETLKDAPPPATIVTFNINLLHSATTTIAPDYLVYNDGASVPMPNAPVVGTLAHDDFKALAGQTNQVSNTVTTDASSLTFGWTGDNDDPGTRAWIAKYTNKIGALNFAEINLDKGSGPAVAPIHTKADLDGQWTTGATALGNGTYTVTMSEFQSTDPALRHEIGKESSALTLTVDAAEMALRATDRGHMLELAPKADSPSGNWVHLAVDRSPGEAGKTVVVYLVDAAGRPVDPHTLAAGVSIDDALVANLGSHHQGDGTLMLHGSQTAYLPTGFRFAFAVRAGDGALDSNAPVTVKDADGGTANIGIGGYNIHADTGNTLTDSAILGSAQRATGAPFVYLEKGSLIAIDAAGSTDLSNQLMFVQVDVNTATGAWSVDGVEYGETNAFRQAVRANLDGDFALHGSGDFAKSVIWDVAGETGYYAPVLVNQAGHIILAPRALGDNTFAFDDETGSGADNDYNDLTAHLSFLHASEGPTLEGRTDKPLAVEAYGEVSAGTRFASTYDGDNGVFPGTAFGVTVVGDEDGASRFIVAGSAIFRGGSSGVLIESASAVMTVRDGGRLSHRSGTGEDDGSALTVRGADSASKFHNNGVIDGSVTLGGGDDTVGGLGSFNGALDFGDGDDRFNFRGSELAEPVSLGSGDDRFRTDMAAATVSGGNGDDLILGGSADDVLNGGNGGDTLRGVGGDDLLRGGGGNDFLHGGDGRDTLNGGGGDDLLRANANGGSMDGGAGADTLRSGRGDDEMTGGDGADRFIMGIFNGDDTIRDFENGSDRIDISSYGLSGRPANILDALSNAGDGATFFDLSAVGASGSVRIEGLNLAAADAGDFIF